MKYHLLYPCHVVFGTYIIGAALSPKTYVNPWNMVCWKVHGQHDFNLMSFLKKENDMLYNNDESLVGVG